MPRLHRFALALAASTAMVAAGPAFAKAKAGEAAPISDLVKAVDIPYQAFTLDNGLRVIVHEDHKAPVVAVSVWYRVGSKNEPAGKTGFAHLRSEEHTSELQSLMRISYDGFRLKKKNTKEY